MLRRINRRVVWGSRGFTDGKTNFSVRDINYSLRNFEKNNGFRIKPTFTLYSDTSEDSDTSKDTTEGSDTSEESDKTSDTHQDYAAADRVDEDKKKEKCAICGKFFHCKVLLSSHRNRVHSKTKFSCGKCGKLYTRSDSLSRHLTSHHGNR
jgi:uncharacterized Zn-finger protein